MARNISVLFIGESWFIETTERKGVDYFSVSRYEEGTQWVGDAVKAGGMSFTHIPSHLVEFNFPETIEALQAYDVVMFSDVGANTFLLPTRTFIGGERSVNKLSLVRDFVRAGGGFCMIGGYLSFQGFEGKGCYRRTAIEDILPVGLLDGDDRAEVPEGFNPEILAPEHPIFAGVTGEVPYMLGYNRTIAKPDATVLMRHGTDPLLAVANYGMGRVMAYACDCSPHWASPELCAWTHYQRLWQNITRWLASAQV